MGQFDAWVGKPKVSNQVEVQCWTTRQDNCDEERDWLCREIIIQCMGDKWLTVAVVMMMAEWVQVGTRKDAVQV